MKCSVIIPVYNEEKTISRLIEKVQQARLSEGLTREVIIVDDGSTDSTPQLVDRYLTAPGFRIFHFKKNLGKWAAVSFGIQKAEGAIILIQDADLEYFPEDYAALLQPILRGDAVIVYGSRFMGRISRMPRVNRVAHAIFNATLNFLLGTHLTDVHTCYKVFRRDIFQTIKMHSNNFVGDTEFTVRLLKSGYSICEVPITYVARSRKEGKKISYWQALETYWKMLFYCFLLPRVRGANDRISIPAAVDERA